MTYAKEKPPMSCLMYEKFVDREYIIRRDALLGLITWDEIVHKDRISNTLILEINTSTKPDVIIYNGQKVRMVPVVESAPEKINWSIESIGFNER